jgi:hypothetical protein
VLRISWLERLYVTKAMDEATVTSPPPELLYTTSPVLVVTAVAPLGVVGARARLVGGGTVDAVKADDAANALLTDASEALELAAADERLLCAGERLLDVVVVALLWRLARDRRLVASRGFSE